MLSGESRLGGWQVVAASVRGAGHEKTGQPCQDAHAWLLTPGGVLLAAVADGAGSAAQAEIGAAAAARSAIERLRCVDADLPPPNDTPGWRAFLLSGLQAAQEAVEAAAAALQIPARELATTLILAAATSDCVAVAQVGDGAIVVADRQGHVTALSPPPSGEHLNETTFLVTPDALETAFCCVWQGDAAHIALLSDGLQMLALKMPEGAPHLPFFAPLFLFAAGMTDPVAAQAQLEAFLRSPRLAERTDDDLTLLLAARAGASPATQAGVSALRAGGVIRCADGEVSASRWGESGKEFSPLAQQATSPPRWGDTPSPQG